MLSMIVAIGNQRQIGKDNQLLWHIREDLQNFKRLTMGHCMIMGRKTFESIGKPLPGRTTIVVTRNPDWSFKGVHTVHTPEEAIEKAKELEDSEAFVIGGGQLYKDMLQSIDRLYLSKVEYDGEADTFFPEIDHIQWNVLEENHFPSTEKAPAWSFHALEKAH